jgi:transcriptional regulator GlxA family with amidase domain
MQQVATGAPRVIKMFVLLPPDTLLLDVAGPMEVFRRANLEQAEVSFDYCYISTEDDLSTSIGLTVSGLMPLPRHLPPDAWILISGSLTNAERMAANRETLRTMTSWLRTIFQPGMTLVTICSGALLAARAGLLDGYHCTTHAACIDQLKKDTPLGGVLENRLFVEDRNRFSSAGISTGIDLALHLVSRLTSPAISLTIARQMVVYLRRSGNEPQLSPWLKGRNHIHPAIHRVQDAINADPAANWSLAKLADIGHLSERHLSRLFREQADMAVIDYVNMIRVNLVGEMLAGSKLSMEEIAARAGFSSARHLRRVWNAHHGETPAHFRETST